MKEARDSNVRSLNDYRKCLGLKRMSFASRITVLSNFFPDIAHKTFLDWNSNVEIAMHAEQLYKNIDNLELYVRDSSFYCVTQQLIYSRLGYMRRKRFHVALGWVTHW